MAAATPLTHHDILGMVEPFARRGFHVDLAASDRAARRVAFKTRQRPGTAEGLPALLEALQLDSYPSGNFDLTRTLTLASGLQATLQVSGRQPAELLARVEAVEAQRQVVCGPHFVIARSYLLQPRTARSAEGEAAVQVTLTRAVVALADLSLTLTVPLARGVSADWLLAATPAVDTAGRATGTTGANSVIGTLELPDDLLAVLGWDWTRLVRKKDGWESKLRLRGNAQRRTRHAEQALALVATHLAQTLAEPPARYHERHARARWWAAFRRAIPLLTPISLVATVLLLPRIELGETPGLWLMLYHVPTALVALSFCLQELPQFVIPPLPRRLEALAWRRAQAPQASVS